MIGRTNVGGGGAQFRATLEITTDPNAVITATNPAGDSCSGTADSSGELTMTIKAPGTYTVEETDGGTETVVIADNGEIYLLTVNAFDGNFIVNGHAVVETEAIPYQFSTYTGQAPTVSETYDSNRYVVYMESAAGKSGIYLMKSFVSIADYTDVSITGWGSSTSAAVVKFVLVDENNNLVEIAESTNNRIDSVVQYSLSSIDKTKKYKFGVLLYGVASSMQKIQQAKFI